MICADTNVFVDFFRGSRHPSTDVLQAAFEQKQILMNPFVLSELLSSPKLPPKMEKYLLDLSRLDLSATFFESAGYLRRKIYRVGGGVPIADVYIAQACIENATPLLTLDKDLLLISEHSDLEIVPVS